METKRQTAVVLARIGFYGRSDIRSLSEAWMFDTYAAAEKKLLSKYRETLAQSTTDYSVPGTCDQELPPGGPLQISFYDAERGQFKIVGDDTMTVGFIVSSESGGPNDAPEHLLGINQGPSKEL